MPIDNIVTYPNWGSSKHEAPKTGIKVASSAQSSPVAEESSPDDSTMVLTAQKKTPFSQRHIIQIEANEDMVRTQSMGIDKSAQSFERPSFSDAPPPMEEGPRPQPPNLPLEVGPAPKTQSPQDKIAEKIRGKLGIQKNLQMKMGPAPEPDRAPLTPGHGPLIDMGPNTTDKTVTAASKEVLADPDLNPIVLMDWCNAHWGEEWMEWEPETILEMADREGISIDQVNLGKMFAIRATVKTEEFFREPRIFEKVCIAFSDRIVDFGVIQTPRVHDMAAAVALVEKFIRTGSYSDHVAAYVAGSAILDGFLLLPPSLQFAGFQFSMELASRLGDKAMDLQQKMIQTMDNDDSPTTQDEAIQYRRLMRCEYHVRDMVQGARHS